MGSSYTLKVGINSLDQAKKFVDDIDEFFFGISEIPNGKVDRSKNNFSSLDDVEKLVDFLSQNNKEFAVVLNKPRHTNSEYSKVMEILPKMKKIGVKKLIVSDPDLIFQIFSQWGKEFDIHIGTLFPLFNLDTLNFFKTFSVTRYIIPNYSLEGDIIPLLDSVLEVEAFLPPLPCTMLEKQCFTRKNFSPDAKFSCCNQRYCKHRRLNSLQHSPSKIFSQLYSNYKAGISIWKLNTRNRSTEEISNRIMYAKKLLDLLENSNSEQEFLSHAFDKKFNKYYLGLWKK